VVSKPATVKLVECKERKIFVHLLGKIKAPSALSLLKRSLKRVSKIFLKLYHLIDQNAMVCTVVCLGILQIGILSFMENNFF